MAAVVFKATDRISIYGNYIEGLSQGPRAPEGASNADQIFPPSKSKQTEIGAKFDTGRIATTASIFQIDRPSSVLDASTGVPTFRMDGKQRNRGIEFVSQAEVASGIRLLTGMAFTDRKEARTQGGVDDERTAPSTPRWQFNVNGEWDTAFVPGLTLTARALRTSSQYVDVGHTQELAGWTRLDIGARYRFMAGGNSVTLRASIENLMDKNFWQSAACETLTMGAPRTLLVSVTTDF